MASHQVSDTHVEERSSSQPLMSTPSKRGFASQALRVFTLELVGTFISNLLSAGVIFASFTMNSQAQAHTLLDTVAGGMAMPPGSSSVPAVVPDATGAIPGAALVPPGVAPPFPGNFAAPVNHLYVSFPQDLLFIAIGIGFSFAMGMIVAPGAVLNPTFSVAIAIFQKGERAKAPFAILGQMVGAVAACWAMYAMGWELLRAHAPGASGYVLDPVPKTVESAGLFGVTLPPEGLTFATAFLNTVVFVMVMVFAVVPALAGKGLHASAKPLLVAAIVVPVVMAQSPFGVQNNPAMYVGGLIFASMAGWPSELWTAGGNYVICVALAPAVGATLGGCLLKAWIWWIHSPDSPVAKDADGH